MSGSTAHLLPFQRPPAGDWGTWVYEGDRGTGKTFTGARWLVTQALIGPDRTVWGVCAPRHADVRYSLEAALAHATPGAVKNYAKSRLEVTLSNGARIKGFAAESPEGLRGYNLSGAWFDEADSVRDQSFYRHGLLTALRVGKKPRLVITTTEKHAVLLSELEEKASVSGSGVVFTKIAVSRVP